MPNIRELRKKGSKKVKWTLDAMVRAVQEVKEGRQTARKAARKFGVPKSSLADRLSGRVAVDCVHGQKPLLTSEDESSLLEYCLYSASQGCPQRKHQVITNALAIYNYRNPHQPRTVLGQTWWINFMERHRHRITSQNMRSYLLESHTKSHTKRGSVKFQPPESLPPSSDPYLAHPLVASGLVTAELARVLSKTNETCDAQSDRRSFQVLTAREMSDVLQKVEDSAARAEARSATRRGAEDTDLAVSSSTFPGGSCLGGKRPRPRKVRSDATSPGAAGPPGPCDPTSASQRASTNMSLSSNKVDDASNLWRTSFMAVAPSSPASLSSTAEPTTSTVAYQAAKKERLEKKLLRCGRCRQPYPPKDPEGLVLWVQCDNCHKMFHTICVSSEMDLEDDEFFCFWCLDL
nr:uncharacterized protein LOC120823507 isoform X1 [Gasterosteus aculeatus aculeatus]